jgi:nitrate/nitrite transporter NarK
MQCSSGLARVLRRVRVVVARNSASRWSKGVRMVGVREMPGAVEDVEVAAGQHLVGLASVLGRNDQILGSSDQQHRNLIFGITQAAELQTVLAVTVLAPLLAGITALALFTRRCLRRESPLLDLRLVRNRVYAAASFEVLFNGAALFGGMIVMPLYFQLQRQASIVETGLLLMAFSLGAAATFPIAGRLTDRYGGGIVAAVGLIVTVASTIPFALLPADANLVLVEALQLVRGVGLALAGMPVVSAAFATVKRHQLDDATAQINILSRVGGALGSALFVVILANNLPAQAVGAASADAFHIIFWWLTAAALAALGASGWLVAEQHRARTPNPTPAVPGTTRT